MHKTLLRIVVICIVSVLCIGQTRATTTDSCTYQFQPSQLILPTALIAGGALGINQQWVEWKGHHTLSFDDYLQYLPAAAYIPLDYLGLKAKHDLRSRLATEITAYAIAGAASFALKHTIDERRPRYNEYDSYPSGHTVKAFTGAELIRIEYGTWAGIAAYAAASTVATMRIYNGRHWLNDLLTGAGIGILSARTAYWLLPLYQRWFHWTPRHQLAVVPTSTCSMALLYTF